jgi:hypothetical protein
MSSGTTEVIALVLSLVATFNYAGRERSGAEVKVMRKRRKRRTRSKLRMQSRM